MKSTVKKIDETSVKLEVIVEPADFGAIVNKVYSDVAGQVKIPGFRNGKAPKAIINQKVGTGYIIEEVTNQAISQNYQKAALDNNLKVMGQPDVEVGQAYSPLDEKKAIEFSATVDVRPEITLPKVEGREVKVEVAQPTKEEIEARLETFRKNSATKNADGSLDIPDDEDLAATLGVDSIDDIKTQITEELQNAALSRSVATAGDQILEDLLKDVEIPLPKKTVESQVEYFLQSQASQAQGDDKKAPKEPTPEERKLATKRAEADIRSQVLLDTYADANDIKVGQEEIINYLSNTAYQYGVAPEQFVQMIVQQGQLPMAAAEVSRSKTLAHMLRRVTVKDSKGKTLDISRFVGEDEPAKGAKATAKSDSKAGKSDATFSKKPVTKTTPVKGSTKDTKETSTKGARAKKND